MKGGIPMGKTCVPLLSALSSSLKPVAGVIVLPLLLGAAACDTWRGPPLSKSAPLYEYFFSDEGGVTIEATLVGNDHEKIIVYHPYLRKTNRNLSLASLAALDRICGRKERSLLFEDARSERHEYGFECIYWVLENPKQKYFVLPMQDPEASLILALVVRLEPLGAHLDSARAPTMGSVHEPRPQKTNFLHSHQFGNLPRRLIPHTL